MFNPNTSADTKIAVLEERLSSYELMMNKIDEAIQLMGKTSQNISKMLAVHEEKLEQCNKSDNHIEKLIEELKSENKEQHDSVAHRIEKIESKLEEVIKFRWVIIGVFAVISFGLSQSHLVVDFLTPDNQQVILEKNK